MDDFVFASEEETSHKSNKIWNILSVDDEPGVHEITKIALSNFHFENDSIFIHSVHSAKEAKEYIKNHDDIALVLLDIVMEHKHAGFEVARYIRDELDNHFTRIVMRTGQPGELDVENVILDYDIDGFAEKTDLTRERLITTVYSALRSYRDIKSIFTCKLRLKCLLESISKINSTQTLDEFSKTIITQMKELLPDINEVYFIKSWNNDVDIISGTKDEFTGLENLKLSISKKSLIYEDNYSISYYGISNDTSVHLYVESDTHLSKIERTIFKSFSDVLQVMYRLLSTNSN